MKLAEKLKRFIKVEPKEEYQTILPFSLLALTIIMLLGAIPIWWTSIREFLAHGTNEGIANYIILRNMSLLFVGILGLGFAGWRAQSMNRQANIAEQSHITDRLIKASELLGSKRIHVRIGAIITLWRTAVDSPREDDKIAIIEMLCAFIRCPTKDDMINAFKREDVKLAILHVIRRKKILSKPYALDLSYAKLQGIELADMDLSYCNFYKANLSSSNLCGANFYKTTLIGSNLQETIFSVAYGQPRRFMDAHQLTYEAIIGAKLKDAHMSSKMIENLRLSSVERKMVKVVY